MTNEPELPGDPFHISEGWLRFAIHSIRDFAIIISDLDGIIVAWNEGAELMFGYSSSEAVGYPTAIIFTPEDRARQANISEMERARTTGRAADERWHIRKDGSRFYVSGVLTPLFDHAHIGYVKVARDLTERQQAEEALRLLNETLESRVEERTEQVRSLVRQLTDSEQAERRRISQILHDDLQQRLYSMSFQLAAARQKIDEGEHQRLSQILVELGEALNGAIETARSLSVDLSPPVLHQEGLVEAIQWLASQMKQLHGLSVTVQAEGEPPQLDEDLRVLIFQTVRELLFNVVKHAGVATAIVRLTQIDGQLRIEVSDNGRGFDMNAQRRQDSQGLLHIEQRLQLVEGRLEVRSSPGEGTTVTLYFAM